MSCFDCSKAVPKLCKGDCCTFVPMPAIIFFTMKEKIVRKVSDVIFITEEDVLPVTKDRKCCFLTHDLKCNIYDVRPEVCKLYGTIENLQCPYITIEGELRDKKQIKEMKRSVATELKKNMEEILDHSRKLDKN